MKDKVSFEEAMAELEKIVEFLEKGDLSLDESIELFQRGVELSKLCGNRLDEVEKKISVLIEDETGEITEKEITLE
jgi:exodeoxyribonuclease VII small subunit